MSIAGDADGMGLTDPFECLQQVTGKITALSTPITGVDSLRFLQTIADYSATK